MSGSTSKLVSSSPPTFEFTKRKRWADLLIHELSDAIIFILSCDAKIWFCGRAVSELLGWSDVELIDRQFIDLVNPEDQRAFHVAFDESLRTRGEMNSYPEILFEVNGHPHVIESELTARCFFAVAKPYPNRNVAILNTFLELKIENERLQNRLVELRMRAPSPSAPISGPSTSSVYSFGSPHPSAPATSFRSSDIASGLYPQHAARSSSDNLGSSGSQAQGSAHETLGMNTYIGQYTAAFSTQPTDGELGDDASRRKKLRKSLPEQYVCVTCGRTDSPEWRKGPQGPKTLCNACGLRWAKEVRSKIDENAVAGPSNTANNA